jgi:CubicO group peptidase (beta-lactamase class C family)
MPHPPTIVPRTAFLEAADATRRLALAAPAVLALSLSFGVSQATVLARLSDEPATASAEGPLGIDLLGPGPLPLAPRQTSDLRAARPDPQDPDDLWATIDACMAEEMAAERGPGAALAVYQHGELVYEKGYGLRSLEADAAPVDAQTQFRIGSITKMFTAAAVMQEVDAGRVDLEAPVTRYIEEFSLATAGGAERISVWNLLTHTSGYPDNFLGVVPLDSDTEDSALSHWVLRQTGTRLHAPPGSFWNYSNPNYSLAGLVAERSAGMPYQSLMAERVFEPAGLTNTTLRPAEVMARGNYSTGYWTHPAKGPMASLPDSYDNWIVAPAGYAFSTVGDLVRWAALLMHGGEGLISAEAAEAMQSRQQSLDYYPGFDYGFGVFRERYKGLEVMQHSGAVPGWGGYLLWVPSEDFAVATLVNAFPAILDRSAYCAVDAILDPKGQDPRRPAGDPSEWPGFVGDYSGGVWDGTDLRVSLQIKADGQLEMDFQPDESSSQPFRSDLRNAFGRTFRFDANGQPDSSLTVIPDKRDPARIWLRNRGWALAMPPWIPPTLQPTLEPPPSTTASPTVTGPTAEPPTVAPPTVAPPIATATAEATAVVVPSQTQTPDPSTIPASAPLYLPSLENRHAPGT